MSGWPDTNDTVPKSTNLLWPFRDEITWHDLMVYCSTDKVIISASLWKEMLDRIHSCHFGIVNCPICAFNSKMNPMEHLMETETPSRPCLIIWAEMYDFKDSDTLTFCNHFPKWPDFFKLEKPNQWEHYSTSEKCFFTLWDTRPIHIR